MSLKNAKCTNCGGVLQVDNEKDAMVCPFCGSAFVVEKAVQNYNVTNNINAGVVNIIQAEKEFTVKGGILTKYNGEGTDIVVPEGVLEIGEGAFKNCTYIESVVLPSTLKKIAQDAFFGCKSLDSVLIPDGTESIGDFAFANCSQLKGVRLPPSLKTLGCCAFYECVSLAEIVLPEGLNEIRSFAFYGCSELAKVTVPKSLDKLWHYVFYNCAPMEYRYGGDLAGLIMLYARSRDFLREGNALSRKPSVYKETIAERLRKIFFSHDICPQELRDEEGNFSVDLINERFEYGLNIPNLQKVYVKGKLLEGTLKYPKKAADYFFEKNRKIWECGLFKRYWKLKAVSLPKSCKKNKIVCCVLCGGYETISVLGHCKNCGAKYTVRKEDD